ncbi:hypothetical protein K7432_011313 [Basidiobolus ranarum]|uniref:Uncharacterized protein n=1 Tax=Basidiobolus ranarum TaxID=34480 RepID=A0ABR2VU48_9FUNG
MDSLLLGVVYPPDEKLKSWRYNDGPVDFDLIEGTFFGGRKELVVWWSDTFYDTHDYYLRQGHFVGKDQSIMNSVAIKESSKIIILYLDSGSCGDKWFYFQPWLASVKERGSYHNCHITPVRSMKKWWNGFFPEMEYLDSIQLSVTDTPLIL